eukprot:EG_transcript_27375
MLKFKKKPGNGFQILPSQIELHTRHLGEYPSTPVRDIVRVLGIVQPVKRKSSGPLVTVSRGRGVLRYSVVGLCDFWGPIHSNAAAVPSPRIANIKAEWELGFAVNLNRFYDAYASRFNVYYEPEIFPALKLTLTNP